MTFCLDTKLIKPDSDKEIKNIVILLHGYGGDGNDIAQVVLNWKRFLPNTLFVCPNAPEVCSINPTGYQWFDLSKDDEEFVLHESKKNELVLKNFLNEIKERFSLPNSKICLSGFSQGCMMSISAGLSSDEKYSGILGFSGKIYDLELLSKELNTKTKVFFIHGTKDEVIKLEEMYDSFELLKKLKIDVDYKVLNCDHTISAEGMSIGLSFIRNLT